MNKDINIKKVNTTYDVDEKAGAIYCYKSVVLSIFSEEKHFYSDAVSNCAKGNSFNISFGKALTEIRASQGIFKQLEIALIKYSFDNFLEISDTLDFLRDIIEGESDDLST